MEKRYHVKASYVHPPIPLRNNDWLAYFDGEEECGPQGWGETAGAAINDLIANADRKFIVCIDCEDMTDFGKAHCANCEGTALEPACEGFPEALAALKAREAGEQR